MTISEELLQFIWRSRLYSQFKLLSHQGERIKVLDPGQHNKDAGPDFLFAKIEIDDCLWSGHVELHTDAKYWQSHGHQSNQAYDSVILHVIWDNYVDVYRQDGTRISTLSLHSYVESTLLDHYEKLMHAVTWIPCVNQLSEVPGVIGAQVMSRMAVDRLESKYQYVLKLLADTNNDWERVTVILLCRAFGMRVNKEAFTMLGFRLQLSVLSRYRTEREKVESLLFGLAGFLDSAGLDGAYVQSLKKSYDYLRKLHHLDSMPIASWKFMRMRPVNFPTTRIGQLAGVFSMFPHLFSVTLAEESIVELKNKLFAVRPHQFWSNHYTFNAACTSRNTTLTDDFINHLLINSAVIIVYSYGRYMQDQCRIDKAVSWLNSLSAEKNNIISRFKKLGIHPSNAAESQGLLHLKINYCDNRRCLDCQIGHYVLKY